MLWLPKWLRDDQAPVVEDVTGRRTFLILGASAIVGLALPAVCPCPAHRTLYPHRTLYARMPITPGMTFAQAMHNEMASVIADIQRFEVTAIRRDGRATFTPPVDLFELGRQQAARQRYLDWRANTRRHA